MKPSVVALSAALALSAVTAEARTVRDEPYPLDTAWNAAVRMVRVDFGFTIEERDRDLGYFTFQYREGRRTVPGSIEILRTETDGRPGARVIVQVPQMPTYVEAMMLQHLSRKLRQEFGEPAPPRPSAPPAAPTPPTTPGTPAQPGAPTTPPASGTPTATVPAANLTQGRWEPPPRLRNVDDWF